MIIPLLIGAYLSNIFNFSGAIIFLLSSLVGIRLTKLEGNTKINIIRKKIGNNCHDDNGSRTSY